jgi:hypothetical protein
MNKIGEKIERIVPIAIVEFQGIINLISIQISNNLSKIFDSSDHQMSDSLLLMEIASIIDVLYMQQYYLILILILRYM